MDNDINVELAPKMLDLFHGDYMIRGAYGGRGSTKTSGFVQMLIIKAIIFAANGISGSFLCARQFQVSIKKSTLAELKAVLSDNPNMANFFDIGDNYLRTKNLPGLIEFDFIGLALNLESIKSKAKVIICFVDEAETLSEDSFRYLLPTLRTSGKFPDGSKYKSEMWLAWNPKSSESAVYKRFIENGPPKNAKIVKINWRDNPWWDDNANMQELRLIDLDRLDYATYAWIWEGELLRNSDSQVLSGKVKVTSFEPDYLRWERYQGLDYGFSQDPTAAVVAWINPLEPDILYVSHESGKVKLDIDKTAEYILEEIPDFDKYVTRADSARPETSKYLRDHGMPRVISVKKTKIEDGIAHLRSFKSIVIHERCVELIRETELYSYKTNSAGDITPVIIDAYNHYIDALRYAVSPLVKKKSSSNIIKKK